MTKINAEADPMSAQGLPVGSVFAQLRIRSGLSRDQVAALFGADRTQLARWVSGGPVPAHHEVRARRLLALVRGLEGGVAQVRDCLLGDLQGRPVVDWLRDGRVEEVTQALGAGSERVPPRHRPLTPAEEAAIWPLSLDVMLLPDAELEPAGVEGISLSARTIHEHEPGSHPGLEAKSALTTPVLPQTLSEHQLQPTEGTSP